MGGEFQMIVSDQDRVRLLPLMEEVDIHGSYTSHDPDQPAHVTRPGPQLPQHQPDGTRHTYIIRVHSLGSCISAVIYNLWAADT